MRFDDKRTELNHGGVAPTSSRAMQVVAKVAAVIGGAILIVSALAISLIFFAVLIVVGVLFGGYLWWKTRELRKQIRTQLEGEIIEGECIEGEIVGRGAPDETRPGESASFRSLK